MKVTNIKLSIKDKGDSLYGKFNQLSICTQERKYLGIKYNSEDISDRSGIRSLSFVRVLRDFIDSREYNIACIPYARAYIDLPSISHIQSPLSYKSKTAFTPKEGETKMGKFREDSKNELFKPVHGIKKTLIDFEETIISTVLRQVKGKYGIELSAWLPAEIDIITNWIKDHDPNFKQHVTNPYVLSDSRNNKYVLCGVFFIKVARGTYVFVDAERWRFKSKDSHESSPIYMYIFGQKAPAVFKKLSNFISTKNTTSNKIYSIVGVKDGDRSYWNCTASKLTPRTMNTIFMDHDQKKRITDHIDQWVKNEEMYTNRGLLFKTGILLHGHAGTGKSSMAMAIANYLGCGLITIDPTTFQHMNIAEITESIVADETTYVILIDEIDTLFVSRDIQDASEIQKEKTAKLLAFLDSPQSPTNVVFVATTNYINRLDKALLRKGRFDIVEEMGDISQDVAMEMCKSFDLSDEESKDLINGESAVNPAQLQDRILTMIKEKEQAKANEELNKLAMDVVERTDPNIGQQDTENSEEVTLTLEKSLGTVRWIDDAVDFKNDEAHVSN